MEFARIFLRLSDTLPRFVADGPHRRFFARPTKPVCGVCATSRALLFLGIPSWRILSTPFASAFAPRTTTPRTPENAMAPLPQSGFFRTAQLILLALGEKTRGFWIARAQGASRANKALRSIFSRKAFNKSIFVASPSRIHAQLGAIFSFSRRALNNPNIGIPAFLATPCLAMFFFFILQTWPGHAPLAASADATAWELALPDMFLRAAPDWRAGRCADGSVGRIGALECAAPQVLGDARAVFADAMAVYHGQALPVRPRDGSAPGLSERDRLGAAQSLADRLARNRWAAIVFQSLFLGCKWLLLIGIALSIPASLFHFFRDATANAWIAAHPGTLGALFRHSLLVGFVSALSLLGVGAILAAQTQSVFPALRAFALEADDQPTVFDFQNGMAAVLTPSSFAGQWSSGPNRLGVQVARPWNRAAPSNQDSIPIGAWSQTEVDAGDIPSLLTQRAPGLTRDQREAALISFSTMKERRRGPFFFVMGFMCSAVFLGSLALGVFFARKTIRKSSLVLKGLAEEGARAAFARHERRALEEALKPASDASDEHRPKKPAKRL